MIIIEAYEDITKTKLVKAASLNWEDYVSKDYYCPGENCNCIVHPKALNSNIIIPHFAKIPSSNHITGCKYIKTSVDSEIDDIDTSDFNLGDLLNTSKSVETDTPTTGSGKGGGTRKATNKLTTIRKAYKYFEASNPYDLVNGVRILDMYCGRNTAFFYHNFISGFRLVECQFSSFSYKYKTLRFKFPCGSNNECVWLKFNDEALFKLIKNSLFDNDGNKFEKPVIVLSDFTYSKTLDKSIAIIENKNRITTIKR